jgi:hypothetical protein
MMICSLHAQLVTLPSSHRTFIGLVLDTNLQLILWVGCHSEGEDKTQSDKVQRSQRKHLDLETCENRSVR